MLPLLACSSASNDPVTTPEVAVQRAKEAWASIHEKATWKTGYSEESTAKFEPYTATLEDGIWVVRGTIPSGYKGKILQTHVRQSDGAVTVTSVQIE
jgi:hypothetical protein